MGNSVVVGEGSYRYTVDLDWAKLPDGWSLVEIGDIAVDKQDNVWVFNRGEHPVIIFDRHGKFVRSFGEGLITNAHGLTFGPDESVYLTDDMGHCVYKCSLDGKVLMTLGTPGKAAPFMSNQPFNRPCAVAIAPHGDIYVADGYGNACVHVFDAKGNYLRAWGRCGVDKGEFNIVHNIAIDTDGNVYVSDRENHRIQIFDLDGKYKTEWRYLHRPCSLHLSKEKTPAFYIGELCPTLAVTHDYPNLGPRVCVMDTQGNVLARIGSGVFGLTEADFTGPHAAAVDSHGDLYVGDVAVAQWGFFRAGEPFPATLPCLRKLTRV